MNYHPEDKEKQQNEKITDRSRVGSLARYHTMLVVFFKELESRELLLNDGFSCRDEDKAKR